MSQQSLREGMMLQGGKYRIERVLGQGGFGITYLAVHTMLDKRVAIKEFFPRNFCDRDEATSRVTLNTSSVGELVGKLRTKFLKEARNIAKLQHPNIVAIQDIFEENSTAYYLMDYIEGISLYDILKKHGPMAEQQALGYIRPVANAIGYMHSKSMNHLDIKPSNIMVRSSDDTPILIDFGTSKQYDDNGDQTSTMAPAFTHGYAPPEQYKPGGVATFTPQTDVYALGATLLALLLGHTPPHYSEVLEEGLPMPPSSVASSTTKAIEAAMEMRKVRRPATVADFLAILFPAGSAPKPVAPPSQPKPEETIIAEVVVPPTRTAKPPTAKEQPKPLVVDGVEFVDLGLSVRWATCNVGADSPEQSGTFVDLNDYDTVADIYKWNYKGATLPTIAQFQELRNSCYWEMTERNGTSGFTVKGKNGNSIFLPFSGDSRPNAALMQSVFGRLFTLESFSNRDSATKYFFYFNYGQYELVKYAMAYSCPARMVHQ